MSTSPAPTDGNGNGSSEPPAPIAIQSLTKRYGQTVAVNDLSFEARPGRVTAFLGPNGAGKTTTLRMLLGLVKPDAGSATIAGRGFVEVYEPTRVVGVVTEESIFHPGRSGRAHLLVLATMAGIARSRVAEVIELAGLANAADRRVGEYSMGMRQRLGLAAALLGDPRALILDEPANGLDPPGIRWLREQLRSQADRGGTVLVSSHLLSEVAQLADDVVVLDRGSLVRAAPLEQLIGASPSYVLRTPQAAQLAELLRDRGVEVDHRGEDLLSIPEDSLDTAVAVSAKAGIHIRELRPDTPTLEEAFLELLPPSARDGVVR
jgi:ABC-2 type transport system ATP-binding protein